MAFDDFLINPMTKIARNCQNFDKFCAIFCSFKFCRLFFYFSVFIKISPFFFVFPTMTKLTPPHKNHAAESGLGLGGGGRGGDCALGFVAAGAL